MKKRVSVWFILLAIFSFLFCSGFKKDESIKQITQPSLGVYTCEKMLLGDSDFLRYFKKISLEIKKDETFSLTAQPKLGKKICAGGNYQYDEDAECFLLLTQSKKNLSDGRMKTEQGKLYVRARYGKKLLFAVFSR